MNALIEFEDELVPKTASVLPMSGFAERMHEWQQRVILEIRKLRLETPHLLVHIGLKPTSHEGLRITPSGINVSHNLWWKDFL